MTDQRCSNNSPKPPICYKMKSDEAQQMPRMDGYQINYQRHAKFASNFQKSTRNGNEHDNGKDEGGMAKCHSVMMVSDEDDDNGEMRKWANDRW